MYIYIYMLIYIYIYIYICMSVYVCLYMYKDAQAGSPATPDYESDPRIVSPECKITPVILQGVVFPECKVASVILHGVVSPECKITPVILHGVVSPECTVTPAILHGVASPEHNVAPRMLLGAETAQRTTTSTFSRPPIISPQHRQNLASLLVRSSYTGLYPSSSLLISSDTTIYEP